MANDEAAVDTDGAVEALERRGGRRPRGRGSVSRKGAAPNSRPNQKSKGAKHRVIMIIWVYL